MNVKVDPFQYLKNHIKIQKLSKIKFFFTFYVSNPTLATAKHFVYLLKTLRPNSLSLSIIYSTAT